MKKVVTTFGRMNPPTSGHQKLVDKINSLAKGADARVYLSHSQNNKKDPLDYNTKIALAQKAFGSSVIKSNAKTIIQVMQELQKAGYTDVTVVVGSDRVTEFNTLLNKYNGKDYTFDSIKVVSAGQRDPDADDVSGMSASKLRGLAKEGNFAAFKSGLPKNLQSSAKKIYDQLRSIMEQPETEEQLHEYTVLNQQQRMKRARMMKRIAKKVARMRKIRSKRMADTNRLMKRSRKQAIQFLRKRVAGERGKEYRELGRAEKITIDKLVQKKSPIIDRLAKRLLPKVRKAEVARVAAARAPKNEEYLREEVAPVKSYKDLMERRRGPNEIRALNDINQEKRNDMVKFDRLRDQARIKDTLLRNRGITKEAYESLEKKAEAINVSVDAILEVYDNATVDISKNTTEQQQRFAAVNHFVAEARKKVAEPTGDLKDACWKGYTAIGMKMKNGKKVPNCVPVKEENEETEINKSTQVKLSELSPVTLIKYASKAATSADAARKAGDVATVAKREKGIARAMDKEVASRTAPKPVTEDFDKMLEDADRTIDRLRWADVPQMEPLKRMSNDQLKGYVRDYVGKNKDQVSKFMSTADTGMFGRAIIQKMAPNYIPATKSMTDKDWSNAWKAYDNIDPKIKSNLKKGDTSDFQNQYVKEDGYKWQDFSDTERAELTRKIDSMGFRHIKNPDTFNARSVDQRKKLADILRKPEKVTDFEPIQRITPAERNVMNNSYAPEIKEGSYKRLKDIRTAHLNYEKERSGSGYGYGKTSKVAKTALKDIAKDKDLGKAPTDRYDDDDWVILDKNNNPVRYSLNKKDKFGKHIGPTNLKPGQKKMQIGDAIRKKYIKEGAQEKNLKSLLSKKKEAKSTAGAGEWGTDELVKNYVKDTPYMTIEGYCPETGELKEELVIEAAEYQGKKVSLNNPFRLPAGSKKKFGVYVKNDKGNVVKVTFGDPNMEIKRDDPERRKAFRSRHSCDDDIGPKWKARYWSCRQWRAGAKVED